MTRIREVKTTFTAGEVSPDLLGRGDLSAYENGALALRNVFIKPTGGVTRRAGLEYIDSVPGAGRLIAFEFNTQQTYLLVLTDSLISIYAGGVLLETLSSPWGEGEISNVAWTQSADTLLMVHRDHPPQRLLRNSNGDWELHAWSFFTEENVRRQPYYKFASSESSMTASATSGVVTLTCSENVFTQEHENTRLRVGGSEVEITDYESPTVVTVQVIENLSDTSATIDWQEQAFSPARGYPITVAFHQDRLVIGGSRDLPNRLWFSRSGDLFNFDLADGLDDAAIEFSILSDQVNAIRGIFSGRHLQVFTSGAEWMVTGDPLTPAAVQILRQTRVGALVDRYVPPVNVDGATLYLARNKRQVQEFLYTDLEQAYQSTDLALLSPHMIDDPLDMDFDPKRRLLFIVRGDGDFSVLTVFRSEKVAAWTLHATQGIVSSVSVVGDDVYMLISDNGQYSIQQFNDDLSMDYALQGDVDVAATLWSGLDHLEGLNVSVIADGIPVEGLSVSGGQITLPSAVNTIQVGLSFSHEIKPLPPNAVGAAGGGRKVRLVEGLFRLQDTAALSLDTGQGLRSISLTDLDEQQLLDVPPPEFSGDVSVRALGWAHDTTRPLWRIEQSNPLPFTILSVTTQIKVND